MKEKHINSNKFINKRICREQIYVFCVLIINNISYNNSICYIVNFWIYFQQILFISWKFLINRIDL